MDAAGQIMRRAPSAMMDPVLWIRIGILVPLLVIWQGLALSGLLYRDVVPPLQVVAHALLSLWLDTSFYSHIAITAYEVLCALVFGAIAGIATGLALGLSRFLKDAFERYLYCLGPVPKIVFFPIMIMWFGVGTGSKVAIGALSSFFPICLSTAMGMRSLSPVLVQVGRSFRASGWQTVTKIYLPAMRAPIVNGIRLGFGIALIAVLLAETKISNQGLGFLVIQDFQQFNMPAMYALIITIFIIAIGANTLITHAARRIGAA